MINPKSEKVYFTGITDVQAHGSYRLSAEFTWQAGEYIKFHVGSGYTLVQSHFITFDQSCNPDFASDSGKAGPCHSGGGRGRLGGDRLRHAKSQLPTRHRRSRAALQGG